MTLELRQKSVLFARNCEEISKHSFDCCWLWLACEPRLTACKTADTIAQYDRKEHRVARPEVELYSKILDSSIACVWLSCAAYLMKVGGGVAAQETIFCCKRLPWLRRQ